MSPRNRSVSFKSLATNTERVLRNAFLFGLANYACGIACAQTPSSQRGPAAYYTQSDFDLPFQVKPGGRCPRQLDLVVSRDGGRTWQVHQTAAPAEGCFRFVQAEEGQYWLKVQARDANGSSLGQSTMHLIVDRTRPEAEMECQWTGEGQLNVSGTLKDANLNAESIRLHVRTDVHSEPRSIPLQLDHATATQAVFNAIYTLTDCKSFELSLSATDRAGNSRVLAERYFHPTLADSSDALLPSSAMPALVPAPVPAPVPAAQPSPTSLEIAQAELPAVELGEPTPVAKTQLVSSNREQSIVRRTARVDDTQLQELVPPPRTLAQETREPIASQEPMNVSSSASGDCIQSSTRRFKINYDLGVSLPNEQLQVELWVTTDQGQSWEFWGIDQDRVSPAAIEVDRDGEFGFCIVCLHNQNDMRFRPTPGTTPDLVVKVKEPRKPKRLQPAARD